VPEVLPFPRTAPKQPAPPVAVSPPEGVRTLVPILHLDMVGYSRHISADDDGTLTRLRSLRRDVFDPLIGAHGGLIVQTAGDSLLVLFASILEAVRCAAAVQRRVPVHAVNEGAHTPIQYRIGIEMGDVIADRGDFHGEGLIVAVRLESACPPGAICVSRAVFEHIDGRVAVRATPLGPLALKNIARRIDAFVLEVDVGATPDQQPPRAPVSAASLAEGSGGRDLGLLALEDVPTGHDVVVKLTHAVSATKFAGKIQAFIEEYLLAEGPSGAVFGGRDDEFDQLDRWLDEARTPARYLLAAPAGRGKSAVLVHWITRLRTRAPTADAFALVFVPISIRFRTNRPEVVFEAIAARLADILGTKLPPPHTDPVAYYEDQCRQLLGRAIEQERRVLLVLDGLDELLGERFSAHWFPRDPGSSLRLVVSARLQVGDQDAQGWVDRLSWRNGVRVQTRDLPPLPVQGVSELLASVRGTGGLDVSLGLDATLHKLTEGEPLVLKLLIEDLQQRAAAGSTVTVADLEAIKPGLSGFFHDWLDRQREIWRSERQ
jgi:class 3 adenylate cyclase